MNPVDICCLGERRAATANARGTGTHVFCVGGEGLRDSPAGQMTVAYRVKASFTLRGGESRQKLWPDLCFHRTVLGVT